MLKMLKYMCSKLEKNVTLTFKKRQDKTLHTDKNFLKYT